MPTNVPAILAALKLAIRPHLIVPSITIRDIRQLNFNALKDAGYKGVVFDKDNCVTLPNRDTLIPDLEESWQSCLKTFGRGHVLIVSNSAGTADDPGLLAAESVSHYLGVPVLQHSSPKPSSKCIQSISDYFSSLSSGSVDLKDLAVVGDRLLTDVIMANSMGSLSVWTNGIWEKEATAIREGEKALLSLTKRWKGTIGTEETGFTRNFVLEDPKPSRSDEASLPEKDGSDSWFSVPPLLWRKSKE
ncbi:HAD-superfamily phosphatase [Sistotremastrum suecicum HHB10207 ss-3]|uniref:HAD-superfamily phosphatase n=1 Tax=Sistotremastrum suecicum HHB10207 ss-3 TaxID=1314776 RepID=A0A166E138_9AGAM|nr:HAD-superfamily phosphatase [Sistotremastrum suecicum HHB10207 ss-3]